MNEISKSINSIQEFKKCYEQELKEILEELNKNGVTNTEGVEEVIKLFFDEYYQYLSVELASNIEAMEAYQRARYASTEKKQFLECFRNVIPIDFYYSLYRESSEEMSKLKIPYSLPKSGAVGIRICNENSDAIKKWYLEKIFPKLDKMLSPAIILGKISYSWDEDYDVFIGSIIYNGNLSKLEAAFNEREKIRKNIQTAEKQKTEIVNKTNSELSNISLATISYSMPSDLFDGFNSYLFKLLCDGSSLDTAEMKLEFFESIVGPVSVPLTNNEHNREDHIGQRIKISENDLKEYLKSPINIGNFWKENVIDQFLQIAFDTPSRFRTHLKTLFEKSTLEKIEQLCDLSSTKPKFLSSAKNEFEEICDATSGLVFKDIMDFCLCFCSLYNEEIYEKYKKIIGNMNEYKKHPIMVTRTNINQLKLDILEFLSCIKKLRTELAMEIFELTEEEAKQISSEELEQKYQKLLDDTVVQARDAREKLAANKQASMRAIIPKFILENANVVKQIETNIENLNEKLKTTEQEVRTLADETLQNKKRISIYCPKDNGDLHLYILNKLVNKYRPLIEPMIRENAKEREQVLLENHLNMSTITPFNLLGSYNGEIPIIGPSIARKLVDGKK